MSREGTTQGDGPSQSKILSKIYACPSRDMRMKRLGEIGQYGSCAIEMFLVLYLPHGKNKQFIIK
jgi:hypothetical protein